MSFAAAAQPVGDYANPQVRFRFSYHSATGQMLGATCFGAGGECPARESCQRAGSAASVGDDDNPVADPTSAAGIETMMLVPRPASDRIRS